MYICNCNGLRSRDVDQAITSGARTAKQVLAHHDCTPGCCRCLRDINARIKQARNDAPASAHIAAE